MPTVGVLMARLFTGVAGMAADSKAASASAMVCQASSTEVTSTASSPAAKRCRLLIVPMKACGNQPPLQRHLVPVLALPGDPELVRLALGIVEQQARA